eukprot:GFUD01072791.1.p1 GENE.GFUD01072791.1~~GFUD01072791.1.p1  ORF type:complete len:180 (+),score=58.66 GFUD01072791.1:169-708(+)
MLFQDDSKMKHWTAALKEKKLLYNFFKRLRYNDTGRYEAEFHYISLCGRERNFVRCLDRPIVFSFVEKMSLKKEQPEEWVLQHNHAGDQLVQKFFPSEICMVPETSRVYHPGPRLCGGVGLVADRLSILWTQEQRFIFSNGEEAPPTSFIWEGEEFKLENKLLEKMTDKERGLEVSEDN